MEKINKLHKRKKIDVVDVILFVVLTAWGLIILLPFLNAVAISFASYKEYLETPLLLFPKNPELKSYQQLIEDGRIWIGYRTTIIILIIAVPLSLFLTSSMGYALSRRHYPGKKAILLLVLFTMIFQGGIVPLYLVMKDLHLTDTIWSVILASGMNTFYMILMYNYFQSLPDSLIESAQLDGAGEWTILFRIVLPLSMPIITTVLLFYSVDKWNEWFNAMVFIRSADIQPLQNVLRSMIVDSQAMGEASALVSIEDRPFTSGIKMAAVVVTMVPIMCIYPFLQKHFAAGVMVGAIKA
ncbi:carbohydrate ABC transporter permease [Acutalibacter muris]|jgi:putative aldouronate transport system permease protein|nr:carbohydrate ABC transporter permease [Acutalibacter muris]